MWRMKKFQLHPSAAGSVRGPKAGNCTVRKLTGNSEVRIGENTNDSNSCVSAKLLAPTIHFDPLDGVRIIIIYISPVKNKTGSHQVPTRFQLDSNSSRPAAGPELY